MVLGRDKKEAYVVRVKKLFTDFNRVLVCSADNVGSKHFQSIRLSVRPSKILMGKNTLIRRAMRQMIEAGRTDLVPLLPYIKRNIGLIFTLQPLADMKKKIESNRVPAAAKAGSIAPLEVMIPAGPTGMEPTKTSFLQAVGIASKIVKGQVETISDTVLVRKGEKVSASVAVLLEILKIKPFSYGLQTVAAYESGAVFDPAVLELSDSDLMSKFRSGLANVAALSLAVGYPTIASVPHAFVNGFKNVVSVSLATDYTFDRVKELKEVLADPTKLAALSKAAAPAAAPAGAAKAAAAPAKEEEKEEEVNLAGATLFGGGDEEW